MKDLVERPMGRDPEHRFMFIQNRAGELEPEMMDSWFGGCCTCHRNSRTARGNWIRR